MRSNQHVQKSTVSFNRALYLIKMYSLQASNNETISNNKRLFKKDPHLKRKNVTHMFFFWLFLIGLVLPLLMIKSKSRWALWVPAIILVVLTMIMGIVTKFIPAESMMDLGQIIYFLMFGAATIGSLAGGLIIHFIKKK